MLMRAEGKQALHSVRRCADRTNHVHRRDMQPVPSRCSPLGALSNSFLSQYCLLVTTASSAMLTPLPNAIAVPFASKLSTTNTEGDSKLKTLAGDDAWWTE